MGHITEAVLAHRCILKGNDMLGHLPIIYVRIRNHASSALSSSGS